ncbi:HipA N-terminal domain-containing protein [Flavobacterium sp. YO64]|uniref:HipA N-terminal domain-containing protein n=1 Tax=Flavobacterium sp. YO64 TaxID=394559 RepID=UPI00100B1908|nr:HipA N-terminal domain-containing protein [Flavobacterium sp. YO64]RXM44164.1 phosphatidylinositol kinase [Flavobacterium sp. YO64]
MRKAEILYKDRPAGILTQHDDGSFTFKYHNHWIEDLNAPAISLTLPKSDATYKSDFLFPFFYNMLPEGSNKQIVCRHNKIDRNDYFGILMTTAKNDSIGAVRVLKIE